MLINSVVLPKITNDIAKYDGRKKRHVPLIAVLNESDNDKKFEIVVLCKLQTAWEKIQQKYPGNISSIKSINRYYRQALSLDTAILSYSNDHIKYLDSTRLRWQFELIAFRTKLEAVVKPLSDVGFKKFKKYIDHNLTQDYTSKKELKQLWQHVAEFISYQNQHYLLAEHYYPKLIAPQPVKSNPLTVKNDWVFHGKQILKIINATLKYWEQTNCFDEDEIIGWLIFSGVVYGGINDKRLLESWLMTILNKQYQPFIHHRVLISVKYKQPYYGIERKHQGSTLFNTKQIIIDLVSQCWLIRYHQQTSNKEVQQTLASLTFDKIKYYLKSAIDNVSKPLGLSVPTITRLLEYASYHWEVLDNVMIDQASVAVLRGNQNTSGLSVENFNQFLNQTYQVKNKSYQLKDIVELSIQPAPVQKTKTTKIKFKDSVIRKGDLINQLSYDFKLTEENKHKKLSYTAPSLIDRINKRCKQYDEFSETILLGWVLSLLSQKRPPSNKTILKYIRAIGYEWLYFTTGQPIEMWSEDDFEILYEDILEYKKIERRNTNLIYPAGLFQRLHDYANQEHRLANVTIRHAQKGYLVRAELVSPQAYHALVKQIRECVDVLESEMLALIFILAYRTGMRKKEILGLKFNDIEGFSSEPSIVVRPNIYRSTKTQSSVRRIPVYALLKKEELELFVNYIDSNIGNNANRFIFTLSTSTKPLDDHIPLQLLKRIFKDVTPVKVTVNHTFHALRHTAVSNLSLVLVGHKQLVESLTDYDSNDILRIKYGLVGEHINAQDRWYALSGMIGHLSPQRSFEYYNHIAALMATYELSEAMIIMPLKTVSNITGFARKKLYENHAIIESSGVILPSIRKLLFRSTIIGKRKSAPLAIENFSTDNISRIQPHRSEELYMRYGLNQVRLFLNEVVKDITLQEAAAIATIPIEDAVNIIERAFKITRMVTERGKPRFVKPDQTGNLTLSPINIQDQRDYRLLSRLQSSGTKLRTQSPDDWRFFIRICATKLSSSRAYISFSSAQFHDLKRFIKVAIRLLPATNWLLTSNVKLLREFGPSSVYKGVRLKKGHSSNTIRFGITIEDRRGIHKRSASDKTVWQYSPLLRFYTHMMMITDDKLVLIGVD